MSSFTPRSIQQLVVTGFLLVSALLLAALVVTARQLDGLSDQSQRVVNQSAAALRAGRTLIEQTTAMERNLRQYTVLGDAAILQVYGDRRAALAAAAAELHALDLGASITALADDLLAREAEAYSGTTAIPARPDAADLYPHMLNTAQEIAQEIDGWMGMELNAIRAETTQTQDILMLQALVLVGTAFVLAGIFTILITRPLKQVDHAINQLGKGAYDEPIEIGGPRDLVSLGNRLDWLRSRLGKLESQRTSFLRHVSHELKTPLAAIQESSALLADGVVGPTNPEQQEILRIQSSNCQRLQKLIDELLRHNADSFAVLNVMPQPLRFDRLVDDVCAAQELALKARELQLTSSIDPVTVQGDKEQLRVVVDNLLSNAIRFSPVGGTISLELMDEPRGVVFSISDQGPGVAPEDAEKIFEAFYRGGNAEQDFYKGSGLGLAIAEEYARVNGGCIDVIAGKGGHFILRLPAAPREERA